MLDVQGLSARYGAIRALESVDLTLGAGEAVAILGPNGAGKTTLLRTLAGLMPPCAGTVRLDGREVAGLPAERLVRAGIALVPEGRGLFAGLSVRDNLALGAYRRHGSLDDVLALFPVLRDRARQRAGTLSGGEQQMLAIGRALMARPRLLLLDEPSLGLAPLAVEQLIGRLRELGERGTAILLVEQDTSVALRVAGRGYLLDRGRVRLAGGRDALGAAPELRSTYLGASQAAAAATCARRSSATA
jgi:branched-chain amino acid transport system ATP-binding protein